MWDSKMFKAGVGMLLLFLIIYVGSQITFVFRPFVIAFEALFLSFLIAGLLYYLTVPLVDWLHRRKLPRAAAIFITFLLVAGLLFLLVASVGPVLQAEFIKLVDNIPEKISGAQELLINLEGSALGTRLLDLEALDLENIADKIAESIGRAVAQVATSIVALANLLTGLFMTVVIVPFLLYFMLKEKGSELISGAVKRFAPRDYVEDINSMLGEMNRLLGLYVQGLGIVCLCVGVLAYLGFLIIGLDYALLLALFIMITNVVPFLGPFIGAIPAVIVGLLSSPLMMLKVIFIIVVVQQVESLLISPQVMGRKLALSPLAIILIVLVAGRLGGLLGIILAIPVFTVLKIVAAHLYEHVRQSPGRAP